MIPIRDDQASPCRPVAVYGIMAVTTLVFAWQLMVGLHNDAIFYIFGFVPGKYTIANFSRHFTALNLLLSPLSYMFLHGSFWHFLGNMWFLYIFGDNVECHLGSLRFLGFYILSGLFSALFHFLLNMYSPMPTIGASGAIAGVMGAYFLLYPGARILTLIPILIFPLFIHIPAFVFLGLWFLMQFLNAAGQQAGSNIAWWAHVGGFITGIVLIRLNRGIPKFGTREKLSRLTARKYSPRLQVITPESRGEGADLYGRIEISSLESLTGASKVVTIPWGFHKPLYRVKIPAGIRQGMRLRLKGMGKSTGQGKGDLFLTVDIKNAL